MFSSITAARMLMGAIPVLILAGLGYYLYSAGFSSGEAKIEAQWNAAKLAHEKEVNRLEAELENRSVAHRTENRRISDELAQTRVDHAETIAALHRNYARRMSDSEDRAQLYERMSSAGAVERANLASHAAQLDRSLEQGRQLVAELRATVEQRDDQLRLLGDQIRSDRQLIAGTNARSE